MPKLFRTGYSSAIRKIIFLVISRSFELIYHKLEFLFSILFKEQFWGLGTGIVFVRMYVKKKKSNAKKIYITYFFYTLSRMIFTENLR